MQIDANQLQSLAATAARDHLLAYAIGLQPEYLAPPHIRMLADHLMRVERGEIKRLLVTMPPRHGKSNLTSEIFPAWYLGRNPSNQIIFVTYAQDLADTFGRKVRNHLSDERHAVSFPLATLAQDSRSASRFNTASGGVYNAVGVGGPATGRGAHLLLIDDPIKNREEADSKLMREKLWDWYASVAYTRLMTGGAVVLVQTRWHEDDLAGKVLKRGGLTDDTSWTVLNLPAVAESDDLLGRNQGDALWPEKFPVSALDNIRHTIGDREFTSLYQQRPAPLDGAIFKRSWIGRKAAPRSGYKIAMGVDLALSQRQNADYTVCAVIARDEFGTLYVLDVVRERVDFPNALALIREMYAKWHPQEIAIEQVAYQAVVVQELLRTTTLPIRGVRPDSDKTTRALPLALRYEQGLVNHANLPSWFEDELLTFPQGEHDDGVDALVYAYQSVMRMTRYDDSDDGHDRLPSFQPFDATIGY